jgi:hypothetical protein
MPETAICERCHLVHTHPATKGEDALTNILEQALCIEAQKLAMRLLVNHVGKKASCDGPNCGRTIYWITHTNGKRTPYTEAGLNHFVDCPDRDRFSRKAAK